MQRELPAFCRNGIVCIREDDKTRGFETEIAELLAEGAEPGEFVEAPHHIFRATFVDWHEASSTIGDRAYVDICVDTGTLMRLFPDPNQHAVSAVRVGNVLLAEGGNEPPSNRPPRGRPPLPWAEMHQELGKRMERGDLPAKKEALVADLMDWCRTNWGRDVSRSAIQSQIADLSLRQEPQT